MKKFYTAYLGIVLLLLGTTLVNQLYAQSYVRTTFTAPYTPISTATGAILSTAAGDGVLQTAIPVGFTFNYYGVPYTTIAASTDGFASFTATTNSLANTNLYLTTNPNAVIAPWWDDLNTNAVGTNPAGQILYQTQGAPGSQTFTIQWENVSSYWSATSGQPKQINFQIILYEGTDVVELRYGDCNGTTVNTVESASIGISNQTGGVGNYIDAVTGSSVVNNSMMNSNKWPKVNFRFTPGTPSPLSSGSYNVGIGQAYSTLWEAVADINHRGSSGSITFNLTDNLYDSSAIGGYNMFPVVISPNASSLSNPLSITGSANTTLSWYGSVAGGIGNSASTTALSNTTEPMIAIVGADYVSISSLNFNGDFPTSPNRVDRAISVINASATNGAENNSISNVNITLDRTNTSSIGIQQNTVTLPSASTGSNNNNVYNGVVISNAYAGIYLLGNASFPDASCSISNSTIGALNANDIGGAASQTYGIRATSQNNVSINSNIIRNVTANAAQADGIFLELAQGVSTISGNNIQAIRNGGTASTTAVTGMRVNLATTGVHESRVYNNFVSGITSGYVGTATSTRGIRAIWVQSAGAGNASSVHNIDFNSISVDASASPNISSTTFEIGTTSGPIMNVRNNIFANYTTGQTGVAEHYAWVSTSATLTGNTGSISNYNDMYIADVVNGFVGRGGTTNRISVADWQAATSQDANSFAADPQFFNIHTDLHTTSPNISGTGNIAGITWVTDDIDGDPRTNPIDIGADQFTPAAVIDMGAVALISPASTGCYTAAEDVEVSIRNYSTLPIDFTTDNVTVTVDVTGAVTQQFVVVLNNNSLNGGVPLAGGDDLVVPVGTLNMTTPGVYTFDASTTVAGDGGPLNDTMVAATINVSAGTITASPSDICIGDNVTLTSAGASGTIQWEFSADGGVTWTPISGATSTTLVDTPADTLEYRAEVCGTLYSNTVVVNVNDPQAPTTVNDTICGQGTVNLSATGSGTLNWYDEATGGNLLFSGANYSPFVVATDTFYVDNQIGTPPASHTTTFAAGNGSSGNMFAITAITNVTITGFDGHVASTATSDWRIDYRPDNYLLVPGANTSAAGWIPLGTATAVPGAGTGNPTPIPINFSVTIPAGQTYSFHVMTTTGAGVQYTNGTTLGAVWSSTADFDFIQGHGGTLFNCTFSPRVFNGNIHYNSGCASPRTPVIAVVTPADSVFASAVNMTICEGDSTVLSVSSANPDYTYTWSPAGSLVSPTGSSVIAIPTTATTYTVIGVDNIGCQASDSITIGVNPMPVFTITANPAEICVGSSSQLNAGGSSGYCIPTVGSVGATGDYIDGVQFAGISNLNSGDAPSDYTYYNAHTANVVADGTTLYPITLTPTTSWSQQFRVWIDYNQNGVFEPSESVFNTTVAGTVPVSGNIIIPTNAVNGVTRMRVACRFSTQILDTEACGHAGFGEYEDYNVSITGGVAAYTYSWTPAADLDDATIFNPVASPNFTTTYQATVTDGIGCSKTETFELVVIQNPIAGVDGFTQVCTDETALDLFTVITTQDTTGLWSYPSNPNALDDNLLNPSLIPTGTTTVQYVVTNQCSADTAVATVDIVPLPSSGSPLTGFTHCNAQALHLFDVLTGLATLGGTWTTTNANGQIIGNIFHPAGGQFGPVQFTYTVDNGICAPVSTTVTVNLVDCTGIDENDAANISLYPNPNNGQFFVMNGGNNMTVTVEVMDMQGKVVFSKQINLNNGSREEINVDAQSGMYLVRVTNETSSTVQQVIIKH